MLLYRACRPTLRSRKQDVTSADFVAVMGQVAAGCVKIARCRCLLGGWQVCSALAYLEHCNVVHRDVAARNVLVGADLRACKLGDFGATRVLGM